MQGVDAIASALSEKSRTESEGRTVGGLFH